ncbi:MAG: YdeI/OmpD-associated family protein [Actinomycetota bacterium]|nr:YdeI/OmpD-associated family protein [Actinomycetota bacterium]
MRSKAFFETLTSQNRFAILYRLHDAKKPETRQRRLEKFLDMLVKGETLYP